MAYLSLYRKYRSQTFDELVGQEHIAQTLKNAIVEDRVAHAYLFTGPRGTGKTSTARILAKALNCEKGPTPEPCNVCASCVAVSEGSSLDVFELDAASHSGVDETREILAGVPLATAGGRRKVYVIDEVHMLTTQSFNALLKTLEEPPPHVVFVLATTDPHKVLPTIVSRTQRFDFRRIGVEDLEALVTDISKREGIDIDPAAATVMARHAEGSARDALSALDQLSSLADRVTEEDAEKLLGGRDEDALVEIFDSISAHDVGAVFTRLHSVIAQGGDPRQLAFAAMEHARSLLLVRTAPDAESLIDASESDRASLSLQSDRFTPEGLVRIMDLLGKAITEMRNAPNHRLLLEVALVRAAAPETDPTATGLLGRIERLERRIGIETEAPEPSAGGAAGAAVPSGAVLGAPAVTTSEAPAKASPVTAASSREGASSAKPTKTKASDPPARTAPEGGVRRPGEFHSPAPAGRGLSEQRADAAPPAGAVTPTNVPASVGLGDIKESWSATLQELRKKSMRVAALLTPSRVLSYSDGKLEVEVQAQYHSDEMSVPANTLMVADALHAALGVRPQIVFLARGAAAPEEPKEETPGMADAAEATAVQDDPIELVRKGLGAEIVEEKTT